MNIYHSITSFKSTARPVMTTGTFDGVHLGHQLVLSHLRKVATEVEGSSVLFTFYPHPRMVLYPDDQDLRLLTTQAEKHRLLETAGVEHLIEVPFTREFGRMTAVEYVDRILVKGIGVHTIVIGHDHRFGRNREGDIALLNELKRSGSFDVVHIPAHVVKKVDVSSTKIRKALLAGDVHAANELLGYNYMYTGRVIGGQQIGRTIGFPTANLSRPDPHKLVPGNGVYSVKVELHGHVYDAMMNIGVRPTINEQHKGRTLEVHMLGFDGELYDQELTVRFKQRIRPEMKFKDLDELRAQLERDREQVMKTLAP